MTVFVTGIILLQMLFHNWMIEHILVVVTYDDTRYDILNGLYNFVSLHNFCPCKSYCRVINAEIVRVDKADQFFFGPNFDDLNYFLYVWDHRLVFCGRNSKLIPTHNIKSLKRWKIKYMIKKLRDTKININHIIIQKNIF